MDKYIYTNNSLNKELCQDIINLYEDNSNKYDGVTQGGLNKQIKNTLDLEINNNDIRWKPIIEILEAELDKNVKEYIMNIETPINETQESNDTKDIKYQTLGKNFLIRHTFLMQKYKKGEGKYIYHHDFCCNWKEYRYRVITFLWYLNSIENGGETEIWNSHLVKPESGKLLLFPSCWTFPHRGKMPLSDNKYIITGWLYIQD